MSSRLYDPERDRVRIANESPETQLVVFGGQEIELHPWEIRTVPFFVTGTRLKR